MAEYREREMSMHKIPLTEVEEKGLHAHGLAVGTPSQLSDAFRQGVAWGQQAEHAACAKIALDAAAELDDTTAYSDEVAAGTARDIAALILARTDAAESPVAPANTAPIATESVAKAEHQYHLVAVNEKTGAKTMLTRTPVTHAEAVTMKGKFDDKPGRRIQLEDAPTPDATKPVETTHAGLKIYPANVKVGDKVEARWVVQSLNNAEREKNGERQIGGDPMAETLDEAKKLAEQEAASAKVLEQHKAEMAKNDDARKAEAEIAQAKKDANKGKSIAERRKDAFLDGPTKLHPNAGLGTGTKRESMQKAVEQDRYIQSAMVRDAAAKKRDQESTERARRSNLPTGNINYPGVKEYYEAVARLKADDYKKPEYRVYDGFDNKGAYREISKTEYDYAQELKEKQATRETITPADDKNIGVNVDGNQLYERKDGSIYQMQDGKPRFSGFLEPVSASKDAVAPA